MNKGYKSTIPYPDAAEAEKILIDAKSDFLKTYHSRLADRKTGLCYSDVVRKRECAAFSDIKEEKYEVSKEEIEKFRAANQHLYVESGIFKELNPLHTTLNNETDHSVELPEPESLFINEH
jgi:hypothetical protein